MSALDQALKFLDSFVESNEGREDMTTLLKTSRVFLAKCRAGTSPAAVAAPTDRSRQLKQLLLYAIQGGYWDVAADICRDIAQAQATALPPPQQRIVSR